MHDLLRLKTRLKLKKLDKMLNEEVKENFGYAPNTAFFIDLMAQESKWLCVAKDNYPDSWFDHVNK